MTGLIVAGMHRSGTSLVAHMLSEGGWHPGEALLAGEREEYYEDAAFVGIHRRWLEQCLPPGEGHRDWGVSSGGEPDATALVDVSSAVVAFCAQRDSERTRWAAKDPRSALFLDQWASVPSVRFVLVYRSPWDVVDSAVRLGHPEFCAHPGLARRAWLLHNRRLLAFAAQHRDRCTLVSSEGLVADPAAAWELLDTVVGLDGAPPEGLVDDSKLVTRDRCHPIAELTRLLHPECAAVLDALDGLADLPRPAGVAVARPHAPVAGGQLPEGVGVQVVIPCRDDGDFLDEAIASVEATCVGPTELTIVDDGSTDAETLRILDALRADGRHVVTGPSAGLSAARNAGLRTSRTLAVLPLDADNRLLPPLLAAVPLLQSGGTDIVHGAWEEFGLRSGVVQPPEASLETLLPTNAIDTCSLIRRSVLDEAGGYDEAVRYVEDWDLWLAALAVGARFHRLPDLTFRYLVRPGSLVARAWDDQVGHEATIRYVLGKHTTVTGTQTARLVLELVNARRQLDALYSSIGARVAEAEAQVAEAARHVARADADRAYAVQQWEAEQAARAAMQATLAVEQQAVVDVRAELAAAQDYAQSLAEGLAAVSGHRDELAEAFRTTQAERDALAEQLAVLRAHGRPGRDR